MQFPSTWVIGVIVSPLYAAVGLLVYRYGKLSGNTRDKRNTERIQRMEARLDEIVATQQDIKASLARLETDNRTVHDLIADENHCGADVCRFCDEDEGDEDEGGG